MKAATYKVKLLLKRSMDLDCSLQTGMELNKAGQYCLINKKLSSTLLQFIKKTTVLSHVPGFWHCYSILCTLKKLIFQTPS